MTAPSTYDGTGWGYGPPRPWSHYIVGDARCDVVPVLRSWSDDWWCCACGTVVMSDMVAHARDLLPWSKWPPAGAQDPIAARLAAAGFRTSDGVSYARIGDSDSPRALHIGERTPRIMVQLTLPIWFWIVVVVALARCL